METRRRIRLSEPLRTSFVAGPSEGRGVVQDVSLGGFFVRSALLPRAGTPIIAAMTTGSGSRVSVHGEVRWNTAGVNKPLSTCGFGVRVTQPSSDYLGFVDGALAATSPGAPKLPKGPRDPEN